MQDANRLGRLLVAQTCRLDRLQQRSEYLQRHDLSLHRSLVYLSKLLPQCNGKSPIRMEQLPKLRCNMMLRGRMKQILLHRLEHRYRIQIFSLHHQHTSELQYDLDDGLC